LQHKNVKMESMPDPPFQKANMKQIKLANKISK